MGVSLEVAGLSIYRAARFRGILCAGGNGWKGWVPQAHAKYCGFNFAFFSASEAMCPVAAIDTDVYATDSLRCISSPTEQRLASSKTSVNEAAII